ncbi:hypothetical protein Tco_1522948 [Tanacetum coccineum]
MAILCTIKDLEMGQMMMKNPPLEQTGGPKEEGQERNPLLPVLQVKRQPRLQERLPVQDLRLTRNLLANLLQIPFLPDHAWNTSVPAVHESVQPWLSNLAQQDPRESFDELTDSTFDFSAFVLNRLNVQTLTPELLAGPTFELLKGTCKSLTELEYFCEELVYKAHNEKLDWINPECFLRECSGRYSKRRIIAVTKVEIVEWHDYKHLDWITVRRDDDALYKFKEGDFHRLRIQDIEDMLLLLVQGKVTNLSVEERIAFNVSLRMFTRSVVIQRRVEDLQLGVESYQKKLNLTKPDTYRSNLRRQDAYTPYSDPRGFI